MIPNYWTLHLIVPKWLSCFSLVLLLIHSLLLLTRPMLYTSCDSCDPVAAHSSDLVTFFVHTSVEHDIWTHDPVRAHDVCLLLDQNLHDESLHHVRLASIVLLLWMWSSECDRWNPIVNIVPRPSLASSPVCNAMYTLTSYDECETLYLGALDAGRGTDALSHEHQQLC